MKYCTNCGAVLPGSAVSFCSECGKPMSGPAPDSLKETQTPLPSRSANNTVKRRPRSGSHTQMKRRPADKRKQKPPVRPNMKRRPPPERAPAIRDPMDINYDGYYDDVPTADNGQTRERHQPELIKRVALIAAGTVVIVILSIIIMYVL